MVRQSTLNLRSLFCTLALLAFSLNLGAATISVRVSTDSDDAEEEQSNGKMDLGSNDFDLVGKDTKELLVGIRWRDVNIPQDATICNAHIKFFVAENTLGHDPAGITIHGEAVDDAPGISDSDDDLSDRTKTAASVFWEPANWATASPVEQTADISMIIQEIVSRQNWSSNNDLLLLLQGYGSRHAVSHNEDSSRAPLLYVEYVTNGDCSSPKTVVEIRVNNNNDDAEEELKNGKMKRGEKTLRIALDDKKKQIVGVRFQGIEIPQGAVITNAYVEFTEKKEQSMPTYLRIWGEADDDAATFSNTAGDVSGRTRTSAFVDWDNLPEWNTKDGLQQTPGLTSIVQEVISRGGWASGNSMAFVIDGTGKRTADSRDHSSNSAPRLVIEWSESTTALALTIADTPDPVPANSSLTYTVEVTSTGIDDATNVVLSNTIPAGATFISATPSQGSATNLGGGLVSVDFGTIATGDNATVDIVVTAVGTVGTMINNASVTSAETTPATVTASEETTVTVPTLTLSVVDSSDPVPVSSGFTYSVTVANNSGVAATNVVVTDILPTGVVFVSAVASQGTCTEVGGTVTCSHGDLAPGASVTTTISVVSPAAPGTITNPVSVTSTELAPGTVNVSEDTIVTSSTALTLAMTDSADPVSTNNMLTYTLTVSSTGTTDATNVVLDDTLPLGSTYVSATPSQGSVSQAGGLLTVLFGTITAGADATVEIVIIAPSTAGVIANSADVTATEIAPETVTASEETTIVTTALSITTTDFPDPVSASNLLAYEVTVTNAGGFGATNVIMTDTLPSGTTFLSATSSQGTYVEAGGVITYSLGSIASGTSVVTTIVVTAPPVAGIIANNASVTATEIAPASVSDTETTTVYGTDELVCWVVADSNNTLERVNTGTGTISIVGPTGVSRIEAIEYDPTTGLLYGADEGQLGLLSQTNGSFSPLASPFGSGDGALGNRTMDDVDGLAYDLIMGEWYGVQRESSQDLLFKFDVATGALVADGFGAGVDYLVIQSIGSLDDVDDIAVDPLTGIMYGVQNNSGSSDHLVTIDTTDGSVTDLGQVTIAGGGNLTDIEGLAVAESGALVAVTGSNEAMYTINKTTAEATFVTALVNGQDYEAVACFSFSNTVRTDVGISKTVDEVQPSGGDSVTYTITATNNGPRVATVVQVSDVLPAGLSFVSAASSQGVYNSSSGNWWVGTLFAGSDATLTITCMVNPSSQCTTIINTATLAFLSQTDTNSANNSASATITVATQAALTVIKSVQHQSNPVDPTKAFAIPGAVMNYTVRVTNTGGGEVDADTLVISDPIPENTELFVGNLVGASGGPVVFSDGTPSSMVDYTFDSLDSVTDDLEFSKNDGTTWDYEPVSDGTGFDGMVTNIRIRPKGTMAFNCTSPHPSFTIVFRVRVE